MKTAQLVFLLNFIVCVILLFSCRKNDGVRAKPEVLIDSVKLSGYNTVVVFTSLKNITAQAIERGVCWNTASNPTIQNNKKTNSGTSLTFSDTLTSLLSSTQYHIRSYITSGNDVIYSADVTINTKNIALVFDKMYGGNDDSPYIIGVVGNEVEGFVVCSKLSASNGSQYRQRLTKLDANGNIIWTRDYNDGKSKEPSLIRKLQDGFLIGSNYWQSGDVRIVLQKFDLEGNFVWERELKKDALQSFIRLAVRENDFLVTIKATNGALLADPNYRISLWDFTVDKNGNITSEKGYPNFTTLKNSSSWYHSIETPDMGFVGYCDSVYNVGCCGGDNDIEVERFGPQNSLKWKKTFGSSAFEYVVKGVAAPDGNYVISGVRYNQANTMKQAWIFKVNGEHGGMMWQNFYGSDNNYSYTSIGDLIQQGGVYYATGITNGSDIYILKLDGSGNKNWEYAIEAQNGYNLVAPQTLYVTTNHDIYLFGVKNNDQTKPSNLFMMKLKE